MNSTEVFAGAPKQIPDFISEHEIFKTPNKIDKIFPSIGLSNFKDKVNIERPIVDMRKEGIFVINLLTKINSILINSQKELEDKLEAIQFSSSAGERAKLKDKFEEARKIKKILSSLASQTDVNSNEVMKNTIAMKNGKIALRLNKSIKIDEKDEKPLMVENTSLFKAIAKIEEMCCNFGIDFVKLDKTEEFKIFSKENITNKEYSICFSSTGKEGAWDIATMSMRGIKSCQNWTNSYPKCLIGSITSKFVGVMYLTSGVDFENYGTKMLKRCVVRYAIDADENKPCIIIDKMYPEYDKTVVDAFIEALKAKTKINVFYITSLEKKLKHIYMPSDKLSKHWKHTEYSYQDSPLKMQRDYHIHTLTSKHEEFNREITAVKYNFGLFIARKFETLHESSKIINQTIDSECLQIIKNIRSNNDSITKFSNNLANLMFKYFKEPSLIHLKDSKQYIRSFIRSFVASKKSLKANAKNEIYTYLKQSTSREFSFDKFYDFLFSISVEFCGNELKNLIE